MKCTCDDFGESPCKEHGFGLLECKCGMRFTAPLEPRTFMHIQCPSCGQCYSGNDTDDAQFWEEQGTDGTVFTRGRFEGRADVYSKLRLILDPDDDHHWNKDGLLKEVKRLVMEANRPRRKGPTHTHSCDIPGCVSCGNPEGEIK